MKTETLTKVLTWLVYGGLFLVPFVPLLFTQGLLFPFITGKAFAFRIAVEAAFAAWVVLALMDVSWRPRKSWILAAFAAFIAVIGVANVFGENPHFSFWSTFERMDGYMNLLHLFAFFLVGSVALAKAKLWERWLNISLGVSVLVTLYGFLQVFDILPIFQSTTRIESTLGNSAFMAVYLLFHIGFAAFLLVRRWGDTYLVPFIKMQVPYLWTYASVVVINLVALYLTGTRGAILGLIGGALVGALYYAWMRRESTRARYLGIGVIALVIILVGALFGLRNTAIVENSTVLSRFANISVESISEEPRVLVWNIALQGALEQPILGWGQGNFDIVFNKYYDPALYDQEAWFDRAHNAIFDWLIAGGIFGLLAYLSIFAAVIYVLWWGSGRKQFSDTERAVLTGLVAAYFAQNLVVFDQIASYVPFVFLLILLHAHSAGSRLLEGQRVVSKPRALYSAAGVAVFLLAFVVYSANIQPAIAARAVWVGTTPQTSPQANIDAFDRALSVTPLGQEDVVMRFFNIAEAAAGSGSLTERERQQFLEIALTYADENKEFYPQSARFFLNLGRMLTAFGNHEEALIPYEKALELSPRKQQIYFAIGTAYLNLGQLQSAQETLRKALELNPENPEARRLYALSLIYSGEQRRAEEVLAPLLEEDAGDVFDDNRFLQAYTQTDQYEKILQIWQYRVSERPNDMNARVGLAVTHALLDNTSRAIEILREAAEENPGFEEAAERYIREIRAGNIRR